MVKIASWNVNSVRARIAGVLAWLKTAVPDVVLLQETKTVDEDFPRLEFEALGYNIATSGQKSYNGVAILSRLPLEVIASRLPGDPDDHQARYIEAVVDRRFRVASLYLPNGNPTDSDKFPYKLAWMDRLTHHVAAMLVDNEQPLILGGDYNVIPTDDDVYDPKGWADNALCRSETRSRFRALLHLGFTDAIAALNRTPGAYTFWDYQGGAWQNNQGLRIDHLLLSPQAADRLQSSGIDTGPRGREKASDHTPIWCDLSE